MAALPLCDHAYADADPGGGADLIGAVHLHRFSADLRITRGGPLNATHLMATLAFQRAIPGGDLGQGAAIATAMIPFLIAATLFSYYGLQRRKWQQGSEDD